MKIISLINCIDDVQAPDIITKYISNFSSDFSMRNSFYKFNIKDISWNLILDLYTSESNLLFLCHDHSNTAEIWNKLDLNNLNIVIFDAHNDYVSNYDFIGNELKNWNFINHIHFLQASYHIQEL